MRRGCPPTSLKLFCRVLAVLAKSLDWFVIQMARRYARRTPALELPCASTPLSLWPQDASLEAPVSTPDLTLNAEGDFQFASPLRSLTEECNTVYGRIFQAGATDWARLPTVVLLHGWNAELCYRRMFPRVAQALNRAGINAAMLELPFHMRRRPRTGPVRDFISADVGAMLEAARQSIADTRALAAWLRGQGCGPVGLWGFSLGAWLAGMAACMDGGLGFAVLTTPMVSIERAMAELPFCERAWRSLQRQHVDLRPFNLAAIQPKISARNILLIESRHDLFTPAATVEELWTAWGRPDIWKVAHGHISILTSRSVARRAVQWIGAHAVSAPDAAVRRPAAV